MCFVTSACSSFSIYLSVCLSVLPSVHLIYLIQSLTVRQVHEAEKNLTDDQLNYSQQIMNELHVMCTPILAVHLETVY
jgi:hypothetical protein